MKSKEKKEKGKEKEEALKTPTYAAILAPTPGTTAANKDLGASPEAEGWKDVLQLLKEQSKKIKRLAGALSVFQQGMLRNNPGFVRNSVKEATEVLGGMLNTHKCLLESGVEFQKRLESHPASKRMGIFRRPRSASLGDTPKTDKGATRGQTPQKDGEWQLVEKKIKKDKKKREERKKRFLCPLQRTQKRKGCCRVAL